MSERIQIGLCLAVSLTLIAVLMAHTYAALLPTAALIYTLKLIERKPG